MFLQKTLSRWREIKDFRLPDRSAKSWNGEARKNGVIEPRRSACEVGDPSVFVGSADGRRSPFTRSSRGFFPSIEAGAHPRAGSHLSIPIAEISPRFFCRAAYADPSWIYELYLCSVMCALFDCRQLNLMPASCLIV